MIKSRRLRWTGHVVRIEEGRSTGTPAGKRPLGRPRRRWEDNIRMDFSQLSAYDLITRHAVAVMHSGQ